MELMYASFRPESDQYPNQLSYVVITDFNPIHHDRFKRTSSNTEIWMTNVAQCGKFRNQYCTAWPFDICLISHYGGVLILPLPLFTPTPLMPPSSPNTKPSPLQGRCCFRSFSAWSERSPVSGPRLTPGRQETHDLRNTTKPKARVS